MKGMPWYYDEISGQYAVELLIEFGQPGNFIVRNSEKFGQFNIIWLVQKQEIKSAEILIKDKVCFLESDTRIFDSLQSLIEFNMEINLLSAPLENKELHRRKSQQRQIKRRGWGTVGGALRSITRFTSVRHCPDGDILT